MQKIWAETALTKEGWRDRVGIEIDAEGFIASVTVGSEPEGERFGVLLPAPVNLHSHAFQRAMAGMTEARGEDPTDSFWTWRKLMYRFLDNLTPEDVEAITGFVQMEMLEAGYASVGEFHYLHHQPGGVPYDDLGELSVRVTAAAQQTGIGLTLLPVLYEHGGCDRRPLGPGQIRFGNDPDRFEALHSSAVNAVKTLPGDCNIGVAPHSLRAVSKEGLTFSIELAGDRPLHMHLAEQVAEVEEVQEAWGARPVEWLMKNHDVGKNWCLIHCTQMQTHETAALAKSGAVAGLCPITESSLGDGIFDGLNYIEAGGRFGIGSDSNIRISLAEELRTLEYSQRLRDRGRAMFATPDASTGRVIYEQAAQSGAQATGRRSGRIAPGMLADLVALDRQNVDLESKQGDMLLDTFIFAGDSNMVSDTWAAGRKVVSEGRHIARDTILAAYRESMRNLQERI